MTFELKTLEKELNKIISGNSLVQWIKYDNRCCNHEHARNILREVYRTFVDQVETLIKSYVIRPEAGITKTIERFTNGLDHQINFFTFYNSSHGEGKNIYSCRAAIVIFFAVAVVMIRLFSNWIIVKTQPTINQVVKSRVERQEQIIFLQDGLMVKLNFDAKNCTDSYFNVTPKGTFLSEEAFFKVKKDPTHPFVVEGNIVNEALGTLFRVNSAQKQSVILKRAMRKANIMYS